MSYQIVINSKPVEDMLKATMAEPSVGMNDLLGRRATEEYKAHFFQLNAERHKTGTKGFYAQVAGSTNYQAFPDGFTVNISQLGIRQRFLGGTIVAGKHPSSATGRPTRFLTIPATTEAMGKRAAEFDGLRVVFGRQRSGKIGPVGLAAGKEGAKPRGRGRTATRKINRETVGKILYWLVPSVTQKPDPSVLPPPERIGIAIVDEAERYITRRYAA